MDSLQERRQKLQLKFAKSGIKYEKLNDLLPETRKISKIETRNYENFKVDFAHTERLKRKWGCKQLSMSGELYFLSDID